MVSAQSLLQDLEENLRTKNIPYLESLQNPDGSWPYSKELRRDLIMTGRAIEHLSAYRGMDNHVDRGVKFLLEMHKEGEAFRSPWLKENDVIHAAYFGYLMSRFHPEPKLVEEAKRFVKENLENGRPKMPGRYRRQETFSACFPVLYLLERDSKEFQDVERFVFDHQRKDGSLLDGVNLGDPSYMVYRLLGGLQTELTAETIQTFLDYLKYPVWDLRIRGASQYLLTHPFRKIFWNRLPDIGLKRVSAILSANPSLDIEKLPDVHDVYRFIEKPSGGISQRIHATGELVKIRNNIKSWLTY